MKKVLSYLKNNRGFTLIELLAVIVILAILMLVASTNVFNILNNARRGSFRSEFLALLQAAETTASVEMLDGTLNQVEKSVCYVIDSGKLSSNFENKGDYAGSVLVTLNGDGSLTMSGWMWSSYFTVSGKNGDIKNDAEDIPATSTAKPTGTDDIITCGGVGKTSPSAQTDVPIR